MKILIKELPPLPSVYKHFLCSNKNDITKGDRGTICYLCKKEKEWKNVSWKTVCERTIKHGWIKLSKYWICKKCSTQNNISWPTSITWITPDNRFEFTVTKETIII